MPLFNGNHGGGGGLILRTKTILAFLYNFVSYAYNSQNKINCFKKKKELLDSMKVLLIQERQEYTDGMI
jgi:hypothetical protein